MVNKVGYENVASLSLRNSITLAQKRHPSNVKNNEDTPSKYPKFLWVVRLLCLGWTKWSTPTSFKTWVIQFLDKGMKLYYENRTKTSIVQGTGFVQQYRIFHKWIWSSLCNNISPKAVLPHNDKNNRSIPVVSSIVLRHVITWNQCWI